MISNYQRYDIAELPLNVTSGVQELLPSVKTESPSAPVDLTGQVTIKSQSFAGAEQSQGFPWLIVVILAILAFRKGSK